MGKKKGNAGAKKSRKKTRQIGTAYRTNVSYVDNNKARPPVSIHSVYIKYCTNEYTDREVLSIDSAGNLTDGMTAIQEKLMLAMETKAENHIIVPQRIGRLNVIDVLMVPWRCGLIGFPFTSSELIKAPKSRDMFPSGVFASEVDDVLERLSSLGFLTQVMTDKADHWGTTSTGVSYKIRLHHDGNVEIGEPIDPKSDFDSIFNDLPDQFSKIALAAKSVAASMTSLKYQMLGVQKHIAKTFANQSKPPTSVSMKFATRDSSTKDVVIDED